MLCREVAVFVLCTLVLAKGMPQSGDSGGQDSPASLPFLQFTNGGIRFNFGGYHAEAGLGGLLGGSRTGGGLHASAGTPWGAHAAAGLGGLLGGDNANAGGGLYARAGLGNGRHEAAAGLGGLLDGSGRSAPASGGLFAGATTGTRTVAVTTGSANGGPRTGENGTKVTSAGEGNDAGKPGGGHTNIQIITRPGKKAHKLKQVVSVPAGPAEVPKPTDPPANKEVRESQSTQPVPVVEAAPAVLPLPNEVNEVVQVDNRPQVVRVVRPVLRKRFWAPRKQITYEYVPASTAEDAVNLNTQKRQVITYRDNVPAAGNNVPVPNNNGGSVYDDIFKIPVSTLNAVNQLLNNNSG